MVKTQEKSNLCPNIIFTIRSRACTKIPKITVIVMQGKPARWRDFHTTTAIGTTMYVFGGRCDVGGDQFTNKEIYCNRIMSFDTLTNTWTRLTSPNAPSGRRSHSACEEFVIQRSILDLEYVASTAFFLLFFSQLISK